MDYNLLKIDKSDETLQELKCCNTRGTGYNASEINTFVIIFLTEFLFALYINTNIDLIKIEFAENYMMAFAITVSIKGLLSFISAIVFGKLSDKIGRKYLIMITIFLVFLPKFLILFSSYMAYFILDTLFGIFNDHMNLLVTYGADISQKSDREKTFSSLISASFFANALACITGEYLIKKDVKGESLDFKYVIGTSTIIFVAVEIYIYFTLKDVSRPHSLKTTIVAKDDENNISEVQKRSNKEEMKACFSFIRGFYHSQNMRRILILTAVSLFVSEGVLYTYILYLRYIVEMSETNLAKYMLFSLMTYGSFSLFCPQFLVKTLGYRQAIILCIFFQIISTVISGIFGIEMILFFNVIPTAMAIMLFIITLSLSSKKVDDSHQGFFIGFFAGIKHFLGMLSPPITALIFKILKQHRIIGGNHIKHLDKYINSAQVSNLYNGYYFNGIGPLFTGVPYIIQSSLLFISLWQAIKLKDGSFTNESHLETTFDQQSK